MRYIGSGVFRNVYEITGADLVVKFSTDGDIEHATAEMKKIEALSKFKCMKPHLPKVYYYEADSGTIVMQRYDKANKIDDGQSAFDKLGYLCEALIKEVTGVKCQDIHDENVLFDCRPTQFNRAVIIDFGY